MNLQGRTALSAQTRLVQISLRRSIGKRRTGVGLPDDLKPGLRRTSCKKPCHCEAAPRPWQSAIPNHGLASGGSLSFCGERKGGKNAAKTNGFEILFADRIQQDPELSNHANLALQNSHLAFA